MLGASTAINGPDLEELERAAPIIDPGRHSQRVSPWILLAVFALVIAVLGGAGFLAWRAMTPGPEAIGSWRNRAAARIADKAIPKGPPPTVAPVTYVAVDQDEARQINARVPFSPEALSPARPFMIGTSGIEREYALTCLTAAAYYEAGNDDIGQAAVIQVVLNRVRHPAFPNSICGVVFQGSERRTGCQFTFTCDGALARVPAPKIWDKARNAASLALSGFVFQAVGNATHYHTDWVVPYWSPKLTKIAQIHTHLFFRWPGSWGGPAAFRQAYSGSEQIDARIAKMIPASIDHAEVATGDTAPLIAINPESVAPQGVPPPPVSAADLGNNAIRGFDARSGSYMVQLDPGAYPGSYALLAHRICGDRTPCRVAGWRNGAAIPASNRMTEDGQRALSFSYEKLGVGSETTRWNCTEMPRPNPAQCL